MSERKKNVKDAFDTYTNFAGKTVAIVDDVVTSGATANELARLLRRKEARHIEVWTIAVRALI